MREEIFSCARCGFCCQGDSTVSLDAEDQKRMQDALGMSRSEMFERFLRVTAGEVQMKTVDGHCIFFSPEGCEVHEGRPWRCRQWPLHPAILTDEANFITIAESCPGLSKKHSYTEFSELLRQYLSSISG